MTLRTKTLLVVGMTIITLVLVVYGLLSFILLRSFTALESQYIRNDVERFAEALNDDIEELDRFAGDWAPWDDTYTFIQDGNNTYIQSNLHDSTFINMQLNLMLFVNRSGEIVFGSGFDLASGEATPVPQSLYDHIATSKYLLRHATPTSSKSGLLLLDNTPMILAAHPIVKTDYSGKIQGTLIVGRYLDWARINHLNEQTHLFAILLIPSEIMLLDDTREMHTILTQREKDGSGETTDTGTSIVARPLSNDSIAGYTMLNDMYGNPVLMLRVVNHRDFYQQGLANLRYIMVALLGVSMVFGVAIWWLIEKVVLARMAHLSANVNRLGSVRDFSARIETEGQDELTHLAEAINSMLTALQQSQYDLQQSEARYRAVVEQASEGIFLVDVETRHLLEANEAFQRLLGYKASELATLTIYDLIAHERSSVDKNIELVLAQHRHFLGERQYRRRDGSLVDVEVSSVLIPQNDKSVQCAVVRDITERKQRERELQAIAAVTSALRGVPTRGSMLEVIVDQTMIFLQSEDAALIMSVPGSNAIVVDVARGHWAGAVGKRFAQAEMIEDGGASCFSPLKPDPPAVACAPLIASGHTIGSLWVGRSTGFRNVELRILTAIGDIAATAIHRASLYEQTECRLQELTTLHAIDMAISSTLDMSAMLNVFLDLVVNHLPVDGAAILLYHRHLHVLTYAAGRGEDGLAMDGSRYRLGEGQAGKAVLERQIVSLTRGDDGLWRSEPDYVLYARLNKPFPLTYAVPLIARGEIKGALQLFHRKSPDLDSEWPNFLEALAAHTAIAMDNIQLVQDLQRSRDELTLTYDATLEGWARALDLRDRETEGHSQRVTEMTVQLAQAVGMSDADLVHVRRGALLHDIGKIGIPDAILLKPGPLTDKEQATMRKHPEYAYTMLAPITYLRPALDIPYCHHERWDGTGYPRGLKGDEIPLSARIFAVIDVWDALSSDRPYRKAWPRDEVCAYIREHAGTHFDPQVVDAFLAMLRCGLDTTVSLGDGVPQEP